jgi:hypothetical protein
LFFNKNIYLIYFFTNRLFEFPEFDINVRYAFILNSIFNLAFYSPILPQAAIWIIIGFLGEYWTNKYLLIKKR